MLNRLNQVEKSIRLEHSKIQPIEKSVVDFSGDIITDKTTVDEITPVIWIRESIFAVKGDISIIGGLPKAGKTSVCAYILATALKEFNRDDDTLGIRSTYCQGKPVVYIDTEQPRAYTKKLLNVVKKLMGVDSQPENLKILNLRKDTSDMKRAKILEMMVAWPDAHLWIIDGVADLIRDPNDTKESFEVIEQFMIQSDRLDTAIILHIHENPGTSGKLRGNLGSEAERKCGGAITIKKLKEKRAHSIEPKVIRGSEDFEPILFEYSKEKGYMVSVSEAQAAEIRKTLDKGQIKFERRLHLAKRATITGSLKYGDLVTSIQSIAPEIEGKPISKRTAENRVSELIELKILKTNGDFYGLADKYIPQP